MNLSLLWGAFLRIALIVVAALYGSNLLRIQRLENRVAELIDNQGKLLKMQDQLATASINNSNSVHNVVESMRSMEKGVGELAQNQTLLAGQNIGLADASASNSKSIISLVGSMKLIMNMVEQVRHPVVYLPSMPSDGIQPQVVAR